jgi:hypothetical protein
MSDIVASIFRLANTRGYHVPHLNIEYREKDSDVVWNIVCGGSRAYIVKFAKLVEGEVGDQAADSHFMVRRVTSALAIGGAGLFQAEAMGRLLFRGVEGKGSWSAQIDRREFEPPEVSPEIMDSVRDWYQALCRHTFLRRAADDAHLALTLPHETYIYVYRGLEWLKEGLGISWEDVAADVGAPLADLREFKKMANHETGVRHASKSGEKLRTDLEGYGIAVCNLIDAIYGARKRLEPGFVGAPPARRVEAVKRAISLAAYD